MFVGWCCDRSRSRTNIAQKKENDVGTKFESCKSELKFYKKKGERSVSNVIQTI
jgi:hypothetical protein